MDIRANDLASRNVRRLRSDRRMSLGELAKRSGVSKQTLSKIETGEGNPTVDTLESVSRALDVALTALLTEWGSPVFVQREEPVVWVDEDRWHTRTLGQVYGSGYVRHSLVRLDPATSAVVNIGPHSAGTLHHAYVVEGRCRLGPVDESVELGPGDFARYPGDVAHLVERISRRVLIHLVTTAPQVSQVGPATAAP